MTGAPGTSGPVAAVEALRAFADALLPGDDLFPPASAAGAHGLLAERVRERLGVAGIDRVAAALAVAAGGGSFAALDDAGQVAAVRRLEEAEPELFATVRTILFYSYYQSPLVVRAVRALGMAYNDAPQPLGYAMAPFDPTPGKDAPLAPRRGYTRTEAVVRVDAGAIGGRSLATEAEG